MNKTNDGMERYSIGNILKYARPGLCLYSPAFGDIKFLQIDDMGSGFKATPMIRCKSGSGGEKTFFMDGSLSTHGECMLFPGKGKTWPDHLPKFGKGDYTRLCQDGEPESESFEVWKVEYRDNDYWYYSKSGKHYVEFMLEKEDREDGKQGDELPDILVVNGVSYIRMDKK